MNLSVLEKVTKDKVNTKGVSAFSELELDKVYPNPDQPRKKFDTKEILDLATAIKKDGLLQPIVVVRRESNFMLVAGERRYKAHLLLKKHTIKAHIIEADDAYILELALIENIQRADLTDFEVANHISKLWDSGKYKLKKDLAEAISKSQSYVSKSLGCMNLDDEILQELEEHKLDVPLSVLEEISRVDVEKQVEVFKKYQGKEITRKDIKEFKDEKVSPGKEIVKTKKYISYGFGTLNESGDYIALIKGDLKGRIEIDTKNFVKDSNSSNYKITIEEI